MKKYNSQRHPGLRAGIPLLARTHDLSSYGKNLRSRIAVRDDTSRCITDLQSLIYWAQSQIDLKQAQLIFCYVLGCDLSALYAHDDRVLSDEQCASIKKACLERKAGKPLQYVLGSVEFLGLELSVNESVLIPRPETEELCLWVIEQLKTYKQSSLDVCDLCTGSGAIALALISENPDMQITAIDLSEHALQVAKLNAKNLRQTEHIHFLCSDLFEQCSQKFDLIVSNPPYVASEDLPRLQTEVRDYEPHLALDGGVAGLEIYERLIPQAKEHLHKDGLLFLEFGLGQEEALESILLKAGFEDIQFLKDARGIWRFCRAKA